MKNRKMKKTLLVLAILTLPFYAIAERIPEPVAFDGSLYVSDASINGIVRCLPETLEPSEYYIGLGAGFMHCSLQGELFLGDGDNIWRIKNDWSRFRYSGEDQYEFTVPSIDALYGVNYDHLAYLEDQNADGFLDEFTETDHLITPGISTFAFKTTDYSKVYFVKSGTSMLFSSPTVSGSPSTLIVSDPLIYNLHSLIYAKDGFFYGLSANRRNIIKISEDGSSVTELLTSSPLIDAKQLISGPDDHLYIADSGADNVFKVSPDDASITQIFEEGLFNDPRGIAFAIPAGESTTYHVDTATGSNTNDGLTPETAFQTIQHAIDEANDLDTILVWPGVYNETAMPPGIHFGNKALTVKSAADAAVIEVPGFTAVTFANASDVTFSNFVIRNSGTGIYAYFADPAINNVTVVNNTNGLIADNAQPTVTNSIFYNNKNGDILGDPYPITPKNSWIQDDQPTPVAHWKLDGNATDSAGTNHGTIHGATPVLGKVGSAMYFDGIDDYISVPDSPSLNITGQISLICWTKLMSRDISEVQISFGKRGAYLLYPENHIYGGTGNWKGQITATQGDLYGTTNLDVEQWYHLAMTYDGEKIKVYLNGQLEAEKLYAGVIGTSNYNLSMGNEDSTMAYPLHGMLDEIMIFDTALSAENIESIYQVGLAGHEYGNPGFADPNADDYHLLSQRGRYNAATDEWVLDNVTSPCIDAGDPNIAPIDEPMPNGGRINIGAYGNTTSASMSDWPIKADFNYDTNIDFNDVDILTDEWLNPLKFSNETTTSALQFDGVDDYVDLGNSNNLKCPLPVTLSSWIKIESSGNYKWILGIDDRSTAYNGIWFYVTDENKLSVGYGDGGPRDMWHRRSKSGAVTEMLPGILYHVAAVINGPTDMTLYVNGINDEGTYSGTGGDLAYTSTGNVFIGSSNSNVDNYFNGTIDNVRIFNRALTAKEIEDIYHSNVIADTNLVGYWDFQEGSGQFAADKSGNGNDGQLGSSPATDTSDPVWIASDMTDIVTCYYVDIENGNNSNDGLTKDTAFATIQKGINTAEDGETVLVAPGTYNESLYVMGKQITVKSTDVPAIIDGGFDDAVAIYSLEDKKTVFKNFIIKNGFAGVYVYSGSPILENLTIVDCYTAIEAETGADPNITSCILANNDYDLFNCTAHYSWQGNQHVDPNLVAYWKLNGDATDSAGDNDGTIYGAIPATGNVGDAMEFDGNNDWISVENANEVNLATALTLSVWVNLADLGDGGILGKYDCWGEYNYAIWYENSTLFFQVGNSGPTKYDPSQFETRLSSTAINSSDRWYHIVGTYDSNKLKLFVDGTEVAQVDENRELGANNIYSPLCIGTVKFDGVSSDMFNETEAYFDGKIDDVRVYNRALSADQIEAIYEGNMSGPGFADVDNCDYHLLSQRGRYHPATDQWILDKITSPCIDTGDPYAALSNECFPNGGRVNMGAYGRTSQASMSDWPLKADLNLDGVVNFEDYAAFAQLWIENEE